ncbi:hypothetical protein GCM10009661_61240 [Catellatospora chokoriensis]|uniref:Uncharacterized protein n=1 Tax=Catellatospora chokoriensis TaxID=310353 RepID=A0A8J3KGW7_9ACTN|nr:hypothetical protein Cch02nite_82980 [Catellatospora chokoriensis]
MKEFWTTHSEAKREGFRQQAITRSWRRGEALFREAEVAVLVNGRVKTSCHSVSGAEKRLAVRGRGRCSASYQRWIDSCARRPCRRWTT